MIDNLFNLINQLIAMAMLRNGYLFLSISRCRGRNTIKEASQDITIITIIKNLRRQSTPILTDSHECKQTSFIDEGLYIVNSID